MRQHFSVFSSVCKQNVNIILSEYFKKKDKTFELILMNLVWSRCHIKGILQCFLLLYSIICLIQTYIYLLSHAYMREEREVSTPFLSHPSLDQAHQPSHGPSHGSILFVVHLTFISKILLVRLSVPANQSEDTNAPLYSLT